MTELLTPAEAAKLLRVSLEQLKIMRRKGTGPEWYRISEKLIRYDIDSLQQWLRGRRGGDGALQAQ